jgi:hypothetical protein
MSGVARSHISKTALTRDEKIKCIYFHEIRGVPQSVLADMFDVNPGRVAEAIAEIRAWLNGKGL